MTALKLGMSVGIANNAYHADRTAVSSTWLKIIDSHSPWHLYSYLNSPPAEPTPALVMGSIVDSLVFEPERTMDEFAVAPDHINRRTKAGREEWQSFLDSNGHKTIVSAVQHQEALQTAKAIRENPRMVDVLSRGVPQPVFVWTDPVTGLLCKAKVDWYDEETGTVYDLKTARDASPLQFARAVANFGYHIQQAFYMDGIRVAGKPIKRFVFAVQEKPDNRNTFVADPHMMAFYELTEEDVEAGRDAYSSALSAINFCMTNNEWAGYTNDIVTITRPAWAKRGDMEQATEL